MTLELTKEKRKGSRAGCLTILWSLGSFHPPLPCSLLGIPCFEHFGNLEMEAGKGQPTTPCPLWSHVLSPLFHVGNLEHVGTKWHGKMGQKEVGWPPWCLQAPTFLSYKKPCMGSSISSSNSCSSPWNFQDPHLSLSSLKFCEGFSQAHLIV